MLWIRSQRYISTHLHHNHAFHCAQHRSTLRENQWEILWMTSETKRQCTVKYSVFGNKDFLKISCQCWIEKMYCICIKSYFTWGLNSMNQVFSVLLSKTNKSTSGYLGFSQKLQTHTVWATLINALLFILTFNMVFSCMYVFAHGGRGYKHTANSDDLFEAKYVQINLSKLWACYAAVYFQLNIYRLCFSQH